MKIARYLPLLLAVTIFGCGSGNTNTAKVTGTVTYNGKPVEGASVSFDPQQADPKGEGGPRSAGGMTDADGKFSLTTFEKDDGAVPGKYVVIISKTETVGGMTDEEEHEAAQAGKPVKKAETVDKLPAKYKSASTSGLTAEVTSDENDFKFEIKD